jgi:hypothetical protein
LERVEWQIGDGPDDWMNALLNVERDGDEAAGVVANGDATN